GRRNAELLITISSQRWGRGPGIGVIFDRVMRPRPSSPRAKQAPRRTPVRWYPTHGYQHDQPPQLQAPPPPLTRVPLTTSGNTTATRDPTVIATLDSGSHINAQLQRRRRATRGAGRCNLKLGFEPSRRLVTSRQLHPPAPAATAGL